MKARVTASAFVISTYLATGVKPTRQKSICFDCKCAMRVVVERHC